MEQRARTQLSQRVDATGSDRRSETSASVRSSAAISVRSALDILAEVKNLRQRVGQGVGERQPQRVRIAEEEPLRHVRQASTSSSQLPPLVVASRHNQGQPRGAQPEPSRQIPRAKSTEPTAGPSTKVHNRSLRQNNAEFLPVANDVVISVLKECEDLQYLLPKIRAPKAPLVLLDSTHRTKLTAMYPFFHQREDLRRQSILDAGQKGAFPVSLTTTAHASAANLAASALRKATSAAANSGHEKMCACCLNRSLEQWSQLWDGLLRREYQSRLDLGSAEAAAFNEIARQYEDSKGYSLQKILWKKDKCLEREKADRARLSSDCLKVLAAMRRRCFRLAKELMKRKHVEIAPMPTGRSPDRLSGGHSPVFWGSDSSENESEEDDDVQRQKMENSLPVPKGNAVSGVQGTRSPMSVGSDTRSRSTDSPLSFQSGEGKGKKSKKKKREPVDYSYSGEVFLEGPPPPTTDEILQRQDEVIDARRRRERIQHIMFTTVTTQEAVQRTKIQSEGLSVASDSFTRFRAKMLLLQEAELDARLTAHEAALKQFDDQWWRSRNHIGDEERRSRYLLDDELVHIKKAQKHEYYDAKCRQVVVREGQSRVLLELEAMLQWGSIELSMVEQQETAARALVVLAPLILRQAWDAAAKRRRASIEEAQGGKGRKGKPKRKSTVPSAAGATGAPSANLEAPDTARKLSVANTTSSSAEKDTPLASLIITVDTSSTSPQGQQHLSSSSSNRAAANTSFSRAGGPTSPTTILAMDGSLNQSVPWAAGGVQSTSVPPSHRGSLNETVSSSFAWTWRDMSGTSTSFAGSGHPGLGLAAAEMPMYWVDHYRSSSLTALGFVQQEEVQRSISFLLRRPPTESAGGGANGTDRSAEAEATNSLYPTVELFLPWHMSYEQQFIQLVEFAERMRILEAAAFGIEALVSLSESPAFVGAGCANSILDALIAKDDGQGQTIEQTGPASDRSSSVVRSADPAQHSRSAGGTILTPTNAKNTPRTPLSFAPASLRASLTGDDAEVDGAVEGGADDRRRLHSAAGGVGGGGGQQQGTGADGRPPISPMSIIETDLDMLRDALASRHSDRTPTHISSRLGSRLADSRGSPTKLGSFRGPAPSRRLHSADDLQLHQHGLLQGGNGEPAGSLSRGRGGSGETRSVPDTPTDLLATERREMDDPSGGQKSTANGSQQQQQQEQQQL